MYKALGLRTLKEQEEHFDVVIDGEAISEYFEKAKKAMEHGVQNEINAIEVLVRKILPLFKPGATYYEKGVIQSTQPMTHILLLAQMEVVG